MDYIITTVDNIRKALKSATLLAPMGTSGRSSHRRVVTLTPESIIHVDPVPRHTNVTVTAPLDVEESTVDATFHLEKNDLECVLDRLDREYKHSRNLRVSVRASESGIDIALLNSTVVHTVMPSRVPRSPRTPVAVNDGVTMRPLCETRAEELSRIWKSTRYSLTNTVDDSEKYPALTRYHLGVHGNELLFAATDQSLASVTPFRGEFYRSTVPNMGLSMPHQIIKAAAAMDKNMIVTVYAGAEPDTGDVHTFVLHAMDGTVVTVRVRDFAVPYDANDIHQIATGTSTTTTADDVAQITVPSVTFVSAVEDVVGRATKHRGLSFDFHDDVVTVDVCTLGQTYEHDVSTALRFPENARHFGHWFGDKALPTSFDCSRFSRLLTQIDAAKVRVTFRGLDNVTTIQEIDGDTVHGITASRVYP